MKIRACYTIKLGCNNCGMADFYEMPRGYEFLDFEYDNEYGHQPSRLRYGLGEQQRDSRSVVCRNCQMTCLVLVNWDATERRHNQRYVMLNFVKHCLS